MKPSRKKLTFAELSELMYNHNLQHPTMQFESDLCGLIVYKSSNWENADYSKLSRTYVANCANKYWMPNQGGNSLYADCLDGIDKGVRLDWYDWEVEYCQVVSADYAKKLIAQ